MASKGGISFPMILVATLIIVAIVLALAYVFIFQTKTNLEQVFGEVMGSATSFGCSILGPVETFICPNP